MTQERMKEMLLEACRMNGFNIDFDISSDSQASTASYDASAACAAILGPPPSERSLQMAQRAVSEAAASAELSVAACGKADSSTHNAEWKAFMRLTHNPKRFPASLGPSIEKAEDAKDAFNVWLKANKNDEELKLHLTRTTERRKAQKTLHGGHKFSELEKRYGKTKAADLKKRCMAANMWHYDCNFPKDEDEIYYVVHKMSEYSDTRTLTEAAILKGSSSVSNDEAAELLGGLFDMTTGPKLEGVSDEGNTAFFRQVNNDDDGGSTKKMKKNPKPKDPKPACDPLEPLPLIERSKAALTEIGHNLQEAQAFIMQLEGLGADQMIDANVLGLKGHEKILHRAYKKVKQFAIQESHDEGGFNAVLEEVKAAMSQFEERLKPVAVQLTKKLKPQRMKKKPPQKDEKPLS